MVFIKRIVGILIFGLGSVSYGETVYFGDTYREVEIRRNSPTMLLFPTPPISSSCQPGSLISLQTLKKDELTMIERTQLQVRRGPSRKEVEPTHPRIKRMLKLIPRKGKARKVQCNFSLASGIEFGVTFNFRKDLVKPFIEFKAMGSDSSTRFSLKSGLDRAKEALRAIVSLEEGKPFDLFEEERSNLRSRWTDIARYSFVYRGTDGSKLSVWKIEGVMVKDAKYNDIAILKKTSAPIIYSHLSPVRDSLKEGEEFTLFIVSGKDVKPLEIKRILQ